MAEAVAESPVGFWDFLDNWREDAIDFWEGAVNTGADATVQIAGGAQSVAGQAISGAQETVQVGASVAGQAISGAQEAVKTVANPLNLAGLGFGGVGAALLVGGITAAVVDQVFAGGAGRTALFAALQGGKR